MFIVQCGQNAEFLSAKADGTDSNHCALKGHREVVEKIRERSVLPSHHC
jgi:hypothetical protein